MRKIYVPSWRCESWVQCHANNVGSLMKNSCGGDKDTNDMVGVRACDVANAVWRAQALHCCVALHSAAASATCLQHVQSICNFTQSSSVIRVLENHTRGRHRQVASPCRTVKGNLYQNRASKSAIMLLSLSENVLPKTFRVRSF